MFNLENRRYIGSKADLSDWIMELIQENCSGDVFADIFAGTAIICKKAAKTYSKLIINDFLYSNNIIYKAFFDNNGWDRESVEQYIAKWNEENAEKLKDNYFSLNFGGKFFNLYDAKKIGAIREDLHSNNMFTEKEKNILLASLIYSIDKIANTVGHYEAYFHKKDLSPQFTYQIINPTPIKNIDIYREDVNKLSKNLKADIVYIDPPYNSRQYSRFYHVLENLVKWEKPKLEGVALKPPAENMSEYCRTNAPQVFKELIENLQCKYIAVSYNNTYNSKSSSSKNKISLEQIEEILSSKGKTARYEHNHKFFNSGKTDFNDHKEFLFITEVR
ncbi:MAG: DNA adenine methylase [Candidatus Gastranaerophilaceae bacterium]